MHCSLRQVEPGEARSNVNDDIVMVIVIEDKTQFTFVPKKKHSSPWYLSIKPA